MIFGRPRFHQWGVKTCRCCGNSPPEMQLDTVIHDTLAAGQLYNPSLLRHAQGRLLNRWLSCNTRS